MRIMIMSDIHGNRLALDAVLADGERQGKVDEYWALGDLVEAGPRPVEVLERLTQLPNVRYIRGNTDRYLECVIHDLDELDRRLRTRPRLPSQLAGVYGPPTEGSGKTEIGPETFRAWMENMKRPLHNYEP